MSGQSAESTDKASHTTSNAELKTEVHSRLHAHLSIHGGTGLSPGWIVSEHSGVEQDATYLRNFPVSCNLRYILGTIIITFFQLLRPGDPQGPWYRATTGSKPDGRTPLNAGSSYGTLGLAVDGTGGSRATAESQPEVTRRQPASAQSIAQECSVSNENDSEADVAEYLRILALCTQEPNK